jgi:hypothetical protein
VTAKEVLSSFERSESSHDASIQILNRAENKLDRLDVTTQQTQHVLERLMDGFQKRSLEPATVRDVQDIMRVVRSVEALLHNKLLRGQVIEPGSTPPIISGVSRSQCTDLTEMNSLMTIYKNASTAALDQDTDKQISNPSIHSPTQVNRLVDIAVTVRYRRGKPCVSILGIIDQEFQEADFETKRRMVKSLQDLRFLIWLFTCNTDLGSNFQSSIMKPQSGLIRDAGIASTWNFWKWHTLVMAGTIPDCLRERLSEFMTYILYGPKYQDGEQARLPMEKYLALKNQLIQVFPSSRNFTLDVH